MPKFSAAPSKPLDEVEPRWFAVLARPRAEKEAQRLMSKKGIEAYVPIRSYARRYGRKIVEVHLPLIAHYVFVKITERSYAAVLETPAVNGFLKFGANMLAIPEAEMTLLKKIVGDAPDDLSFHSIDVFEKGDAVRVTTGSLAGLQGRLVDFQGAKKLVVEMASLDFAFTMTIERSMLEKVRASSF